MSRMIEGKVKINSFAELFGGDPSEIIEVALNELHTFKDHPFKVIDDEKMMEIVESIKEHGVLEPGVVRYKAGTGYEIISGHRRKRACEIAGLATMPVVVRKLTDDEAVLAMVASNLQREEILPSEKAFAYKMKMEAISHQGVSENDTSRQLVGKSESADIIGKDTGESGRQVQRYIRLTELDKELLDMVDEKKLKLNPAVELSYLKEKEQDTLLKEMSDHNVIPSLIQARQLKKLSQDRAFTKEAVHAIMAVASAKGKKFIIKQDIITKYFSPETSDEDIEEIICTLLDEWQRNGGRK